MTVRPYRPNDLNDLNDLSSAVGDALVAVRRAMRMLQELEPPVGRAARAPGEVAHRGLAAPRARRHVA